MFIDPYLGNVTIFAGNFAPRSWMFCQGQLLSIADYSALFALLGTTFGGDGQNTFGLPDLRGRTAIHAGQGSGLAPYVLGQIGGVENATILSAQMPIHSHAFVSATGNPGASTTAGTQQIATNNVPATVNGSPAAYNTTPASTGSLGVSNITANTVIAGGSQPIALRAPYMAMNYIIAVEGIFPSRN